MPRFRVFIEVSGSDYDEILTFDNKFEADTYIKEMALETLSYGAEMIDDDEDDEDDEAPIDL